MEKKILIRDFNNKKRIRQIYHSQRKRLINTPYTLVDRIHIIGSIIYIIFFVLFGISTPLNKSIFSLHG